MMDFRYGIYDLAHIQEIIKQQGADRYDLDATIIDDTLNEDALNLHAISEHVHINYCTHEGVAEPELFVLRFGPQAKLSVPSAEYAHTLMFLIVPTKPVGLDLRLAGHLAEVVQSEHFEQRWLESESERDMNEVLMRDDHFLHGPVSQFPSLHEQAGRKIADVSLPASCLIAMIERGGKIIVATPDIELLATDEVAIIGEPVDLQELKKNPKRK